MPSLTVIMSALKDQFEEQQNLAFFTDTQQHIKNANASQLAKDKATLHLAEEGVSLSFR